MRLNKFLARATGASRREADEMILRHEVKINGEIAKVGAQVDETRDEISRNGQKLTLPPARTLIMLNKPVGYVSSRNAQNKFAKTLYELLPREFNRLKTVGRLDKDSSGLILLTDDGDLSFHMTHPKFAKTKIYFIKLDKPLQPLHQQMISDFGVDLADGKSRLILEKVSRNELNANDARAIGFAKNPTHVIPSRVEGSGLDSRKNSSTPLRSSQNDDDNDSRKFWRIVMSEGRNRQIRRTFASLGYVVTKLHRVKFGEYELGELKPGDYKNLE